MNQERQIKCYGMTTADIDELYGNCLTARFSGIEMVVMSILSDCQELVMFSMDRDSRVSEQVRQQLNIAKYLLSGLHGRNQERLHKEAA